MSYGHLMMCTPVHGGLPLMRLHTFLACSKNAFRSVAFPLLCLRVMQPLSCRYSKVTKST